MSDADLFGGSHGMAHGIGVHQGPSGGSDEWLTPPEVIAALGRFDLDPCAPADDGLRQPWEGRVWLNPPYLHAAKWLARLAEHGTGTALIFARTETDLWFRHVWSHATGLLFIRKRLHFHFPDGKRARQNSGAPSVLVAYGAADAEVLATRPIEGAYVAAPVRGFLP